MAVDPSAKRGSLSWIARSAYVHRQYPASQSSPWWVFSDTSDPLWLSTWKVLRNRCVFQHCSKFTGIFLMRLRRATQNMWNPWRIPRGFRHRGAGPDQTQPEQWRLFCCGVLMLWADSILKRLSAKLTQDVVDENRKKKMATIPNIKAAPINIFTSIIKNSKWG